MKTKTISIQQNQESKSFRDVYVDDKFIGSVISDGKMTALDCYKSLMNNREIDRMEACEDARIDSNSSY